MDLETLNLPYVALQLCLQIITMSSWNVKYILASFVSNVHITNLFLMHYYDARHQSLLSYSISLIVFNSACVFYYATLLTWLELPLASVCLQVFQLNMHVSKMKIVYVKQLSEHIDKKLAKGPWILAPSQLCFAASICCLYRVCSALIPWVLLFQILVMYWLNYKTSYLLIAIQMLLALQLTHAAQIVASTIFCVMLLHRAVRSDGAIATDIFLCNKDVFLQVINEEMLVKYALLKQQTVSRYITALHQQKYAQNVYMLYKPLYTRQNVLKIRQYLAALYSFTFMYPHRLPRSISENELNFVFAMFSPASIMETRRYITSLGMFVEYRFETPKSSYVSRNVRFIVLDHLIVVHGAHNCDCRAIYFRRDFVSVVDQLIAYLQNKQAGPDLPYLYLLAAIFKRTGISAVISPYVSVVYVPVR